MPEYKQLPGAIAVKDISGRTVTGIASVMGNRDAYNDIIWPGAYAKTLAENRRRIKHFWQHAWQNWVGVAEPPIAAIDEIAEVGRDALPSGVLDAAPDALGGLEVRRTYLTTPRGNEVLEGIKAGVITEMSIGYEAIKFDYEEDEVGMRRNLREVRLLETSDVIWGANDATAASKSGLLLPDLATLLAILEQHAKAGRRNSDADQARINDICRLAYELGADYDYAGNKPDDDDERREDMPDDDQKAEPPEKALTLRRRVRALELQLKLAGVHRYE